MEEKEKSQLNKAKILNNTIAGILIIVLSTVILFALYTIASQYLKEDNVSATTKADLARIQEAIDKVSSNYVDEIDREKMIEGAISGVAKSTGDPYTRYLTDEEFEAMNEAGNEKYNGLGIHITYDEASHGIIILSVMPDSSALEEGLLAGDIILKVADKVVSIDSYYDCVDAIKGEENSKVALTIKRGDETFEKEYTRRKVNVNNVESKVLESNIGYIRVLTFDNNVAAQFKTEYNKLKEAGIKGLIIDLRNNPGGLVTQCLDIARLMLPKGDIVKLVYRNRPDKVYTCDGNSEITIPLYVLINGHSASASEILAGAIKDANKGILIGTKTYGKGIVQSVEKLKEGAGAISITTSKYYTASGIEIHKNGIEPNIEVKLDEEYENKAFVPYEKDYQLQKAIEEIKAK